VAHASRTMVSLSFSTTLPHFVQVRGGFTTPSLPSRHRPSVPTWLPQRQTSVLVR
jgi:hypothetical protein